ncbi:MAG: hypothetical protein AB7Q17_07795 [Phycisphaerae bacterium]
MLPRAVSVDRARAGIAGGDRFAHQLLRLLARRRFGPLVLWLQDGRRIGIHDPQYVRVCRATGTIELTVRGDVQEILFEELLAIELRPRSVASAVAPQHV